MHTLNIPDIKLIDRERNRIEPAPRKYRKIVILSFIASGICVLSLLTQGMESLVIGSKTDTLAANNKKSASQIAEAKKIIGENDSLLKFYESTQIWVNGNTFFSKILADVSDSIPESGKLHGFKLSRNQNLSKESYLLEIKISPMKEMNKDSFLKKINESLDKKGLFFSKQKDEPTKDKNVLIIGTVERKALI